MRWDTTPVRSVIGTPPISGPRRHRLYCCTARVPRTRFPADALPREVVRQVCDERAIQIMMHTAEFAVTVINLTE